MTMEEAIAILQSMIPTPCRADGKSTTHTLVTIALDMAIKALGQTEPEKCGDCISRNAIIETLNEMDRYVANELTLCKSNNKFPQNEVFIVDDVYEQIAEELPSVEPDGKKGLWLKRTDKTKKLYGWYQCSQCLAIIGEPTNYCSECGARMEVDNG